MAKGVAPRVAPLLLLFAAAAEAGRKKEVVEKPLPSVSMQMLDLTLSPLKKLAAAYSELPVAEHMTLPMFAGTCVLSLFLLWVISRILDPKPYLYNGGKLGYLEKKSVFVCEKTGKVGIQKESGAVCPKTGKPLCECPK
jgi:hypothetical protein